MISVAGAALVSTASCGREESAKKSRPHSRREQKGKNETHTQQPSEKEKRRIASFFLSIERPKIETHVTETAPVLAERRGADKAALEKDREQDIFKEQARKALFFSLFFLLFERRRSSGGRVDFSFLLFAFDEQK